MRPLQKTLNDLGPKHLGAEDWKPLKADGVLGPKTADAFGRVAERVDPLDLAQSFGRTAGIL